LNEGKDRFSGGAPQLVGIWRKGPARTFGFWWHGKQYFAGLEMPVGSNVSRVDWFNHRFERCDPMTGRRLEGAQRHNKPRVLVDPPHLSDGARAVAGLPPKEK